MEMAQRISDLSDQELENLHANAVRLAQSGTPKQQQQAETLLPLLVAALAERDATRVEQAAERRRTASKRKTAARQEAEE